MYRLVPPKNIHSPPFEEQHYYRGQVLWMPIYVKVGSEHRECGMVLVTVTDLRGDLIEVVPVAGDNTPIWIEKEHAELYERHHV